MPKIKKIPVEFYMLLSDHTWDTTVINVPQKLVSQFNIDNYPQPIIDWAEKNEKFEDNVWLIGIYSV